MHSRQPVPPSVTRLALHQAGVLSREQALGCGLSRRAVDRLVLEGRWTPLGRGVYCSSPVDLGPTCWRRLQAVQPSSPPGWLALAWAGCLLGGDAARVGGAAAGHLWGLVTDPPDLIQILVPHDGGRPRVAGPWSFVRERAGVRDPRSPGSPPRAGLVDTALDLSAADGDALRWLTAAIQTRRTDVARLRSAAEGRSRLPHRWVILRTLDDLAAGAESVLELHYLRDVERAHGLPTAERQARRRGTLADVWYREFRLLVELDGRRGHDGSGRFRDMDRDNRATTDGLATLRYGWSDVLDRPCAVAAQVAENLVIRGWRGLPGRCSRCRRVA